MTAPFRMVFVALVVASWAFAADDAADEPVITAGDNVAKPIMVIQYDDGRGTDYTKCFPIHQRLGVPAVTNIIVAKIGQPGKVTLAQIKEMNAAGWEVASHTRTHPHLADPKLTEEQLTREIKGSKDELTAMGFTVTSFAYPFGEYSPRVAAMVAEHYEMARAGKRKGTGQYNVNEIDSIQRASLTTYNFQTDKMTDDQINEALDKTVKQKALCIMFAHSDTNVPEERLVFLIEQAKSRNISVMTLKQAHDYLRSCSDVTWAK